MSKHCKRFKKHCFEMFTEKQEVNMKSFMEHLNSERSKSDNFKKLPLLSQILSFM